MKLSEAEIHKLIGVWYPKAHTFLKVAEKITNEKLLGLFIVSAIQGYTTAPLRYVPVEYFVRSIFQVSTALLGVSALEQPEKMTVTFEQLQGWMSRHRVYTHWIQRLKFSAMCETETPFDISVLLVEVKARRFLPTCVVEISGAVSGIAQYVVDRRQGPDTVYHVPGEIKRRYPELF